MLGTYTFDQNSQVSLSSAANGNVIADEVKLVATAAPVPTGANLYYIHNDHLGTLQVFTDENQHVVWQADYQPFGEVSESVTIFANNLRFAGQYFDGESGLHYNYFRDYDPGTGRYLQSDPVGLAGGLNTYAYVGGNPLRFFDPFGLFSCWINDIGQTVCDGGNPYPDNYSPTGGSAAFPSSTNNRCTLECINENSSQVIASVCGSVDFAVTLLTGKPTLSSAAGGACLVVLNTLDCTLDGCDDGECE